MSTSLACTLPYPGEKHLAITSEDDNKAVCYPDTITWTRWTTVDDCFPHGGDGSQTKPSFWPSFLLPHSPDSPNALPLATSFPKKKKDPGSYWKLLLLFNIIINEYLTLPLNSRYWEAISRWNEAISLTPKNEKLYEMKSQVRLRVEEVRGTGAKDGLLST